MKNICLILYALFSSISIHAQEIWISFDHDDLDYCNAVLAESMLYAFGEDSVYTWLKNDYSLRVKLITDTLGYLQKIEKVSSKNIKLSTSDILKLEQTLKKINHRLPLCYEMAEAEKSRMKEIIIRDLRAERKNSIRHYLAFSRHICYPPCLTVETLERVILKRIEEKQRYQLFP